MIRISNEKTQGVVIADAVQLLPEESLSDPKPKPTPNLAAVSKLEKESEKLNAELKALQKKKPSSPIMMAVSEMSKVADTPVRIRGIARNFGETAPRGFLQVTYREGSPILPSEASSGRLELANWVVSENNPLTARVLANRIWLHLFGEGIVFFTRQFLDDGQRAKSPELLDFLATRLVENGWSAKSLIREIVLSRTWQQSSENSVSDPENRLLAKFPRKRIDAETLRDSILSISGTLNSESGGPALPTGFKSEFGHQFTSLKRAVYIRFSEIRRTNCKRPLILRIRTSSSANEAKAPFRPKLSSSQTAIS